MTSFRLAAGIVVVLFCALPLSTLGRAGVIDDSTDCYQSVAEGENQLAVFYCDRAISSGELPQADLVTALLNRGVAHKALGNLELAIADYSYAIELAPEDALAYANRANARLAKGELNTALEDINKALELNPNRATAFYVRGRIFEDMAIRDLARLDFLRAHELQPDHPDFKEKAWEYGTSSAVQ